MTTSPVQGDVLIVNERGLHTRTSTQIVKLAQQFKSEIEFSLDGRSADGKSIIGLLSLGVARGKILTIRVSGEDQDEALRAIKELIEAGFPEDTA